MHELDVLQEMGLSAAEAQVYLALLELGNAKAGPIIKKTGLHRGTCYQVLQRLHEKGLVSSIVKGKKQHFSAVNPERLLDLLKEREEKFQEILPQLKAKAETHGEQHVTVYYGTKGIRSVLDHVLNELKDSGEYVDFGVSGKFREIMGAYWDSWQKRKKKYHIKSKVIFNEEVKEKNPELLKDYYGEARYHPKEYSSITDTIIYNDTVILITWTAKPPIAVVIQNKENSESYKNQFKLMWKQATI